MARFANGWVKLYRSVADGDLVENPTLLALWTWMLMTATWRPTKIAWQGRQREIPAGSVVFGFKELASRWKCSRSTIHKWAHYLHDSERIALESSTRGSLAIIRNWDAYQVSDGAELTPSERGVNTARTPREHEVALIEEVKKGRREEYASPEKIGEAIEEWGKTLLARGIQKNPKHDEQQILRLLQRYGHERTLDALRGARFEIGSTDYNPKQHCRISRIAGEKFDYFENLGAQHRELGEPETFNPDSRKGA